MSLWTWPVFGVPAGPLLLWSGVTAVVYTGCRWVFVRTRWSVLHPGATAIFVTAAILALTPERSGEFQKATEWINWLLGPAGWWQWPCRSSNCGAPCGEFAGTLAIVVPLGVAFAVGQHDGVARAVRAGAARDRGGAR